MMRRAPIDLEVHSAPVSCGAPAAGSQVAIVDPSTCRQLADGEAGEVWIAGPHIGKGYLGSPQATLASFGARLDAFADMSFFRTGDIGVLDRDGLMINARIKDIIIHRGINIHAADVEAVVAACHPAFGELGAAFAWEDGEVEHVVLVHEAARNLGQPPWTAMLHSALDAVALHHGVRLFDLVLVRAGSIPRTSSGKVRRDACRILYVQGKLNSLAASSTRAADADRYASD